MKQPRKVLIVEDLELLQLGIRVTLKPQRNYDVVHEARSGTEAWACINEHKQDIDLIITNASLPELSGLELCEKVKQEFPEIIVVMYAMTDQEQTLQDAIQAGVNGFIPRRSSREEFIQALERVLENGTNFSAEALHEHRIQARKKQQMPQLTKREKQILDLIAKQYTSEQIAKELNLSKKTIDVHRSNMMQKFDVKSTIGLMVTALGVKIP